MWCGVVLQLGLDVWKRLLAEPLKDTLVTLLLAELHKYVTIIDCVSLQCFLSLLYHAFFLFRTMAVPRVWNNLLTDLAAGLVIQLLQTLPNMYLLGQCDQRLWASPPIQLLSRNFLRSFFIYVVHFWHLCPRSVPYRRCCRNSFYWLIDWLINLLIYRLTDWSLLMAIDIIQHSNGCHDYTGSCHGDYWGYWLPIFCFLLFYEMKCLLIVFYRKHFIVSLCQWMVCTCVF